MIRRQPRSPLFPYPALFRSDRLGVAAAGFPGVEEDAPQRSEDGAVGGGVEVSGDQHRQGAVERPVRRELRERVRLRVPRSEEHTSELQSRQYLVCSLLLEKK